MGTDPCSRSDGPYRDDGLTHQPRRSRSFPPMQRVGGAEAGVSRRAFLQRAGLFGAAFAGFDLVALLDKKGLLATAQAASTDLTVDTLSGLIAFIVPGNDEYSVAQGQKANGPGGIAAGGVEALSSGLDRYVPVTTLGVKQCLPASGGVAPCSTSTRCASTPSPPEAASPPRSRGCRSRRRRRSSR